MNQLKNMLLASILYVFSNVARAADDGHEAVSDWSRLLTPDRLARQEAVIFADGRGLPSGQGSVDEGRALFERHCLRCHGREGRGGHGGELAGGNSDLSRPSPDQTIGSYWPYATTLFDFIRRAMPMDAPRVLSDSEVYALCAYLLFLNGLLGQTATLDGPALAAIRMPNRDGFIGVDAALPRLGHLTAPATGKLSP